MKDFEMDHESILENLNILKDRCEKSGIEVDITLVGGAAMLLHGSNRQVTKDIDAAIRGDLKIHDIAREMAKDLDLPTDWFNSAASPWIPPSDDRELTVSPGIKIASEETILAMKVNASRERDQEDILELCEKLNIKSVDEMMDVIEEVYNHDETPLGYGGFDDIRLTVENFFENRNSNSEVQKSIIRETKFSQDTDNEKFKCSVCGRPLKAKSSIARGVGPGCAIKSA